ncbi:MAG: hypothetical protein DI630_21935 [Gordonia sp. (in: high G+C Gram-positive bacteria)]|nr:MAG: hypothetical protein DI630_21935 [Gordonia sp. (in: high G+C Gram-positive bacteria)]
MAGVKQTARPQEEPTMPRPTRNGTQRDVFTGVSRTHQNRHTIRAAKRQANRQDRAAARRDLHTHH